MTPLVAFTSLPVQVEVFVSHCWEEEWWTEAVKTEEEVTGESCYKLDREIQIYEFGRR